MLFSAVLHAAPDASLYECCATPIVHGDIPIRILQVMEAMYGQSTCGVYGYSHLTGGYQGGQAEFVRVPLGEQQQLCVPGRPVVTATYAPAILTHCWKERIGRIYLQ